MKGSEVNEARDTEAVEFVSETGAASPRARNSPASFPESRWDVPLKLSTLIISFKMVWPALMSSGSKARFSAEIQRLWESSALKLTKTE